MNHLLLQLHSKRALSTGLFPCRSAPLAHLTAQQRFLQCRYRMGSLSMQQTSHEA